MLEVIRASKRSNPRDVGGALAHAHRKGSDILLSAVGRDASYVAMLAVAYANRYLAETGDIRILIEPTIENIGSAGEDRTAVVSLVYDHCHQEQEEGEDGDLYGNGSDVGVPR